MTYVPKIEAEIDDFVLGDLGIDEGDLGTMEDDIEAEDASVDEDGELPVE